MIKNFLIVMAGGAVGSALRYAVSLLCKHWHFTNLPAGTLTVNLLGCLIMGLLMGTAERYTSLSESIYLMLAVGLCGAFTTFSTFAADTVRLMDNGHWIVAAGYIVASFAGGLLLFGLARTLVLR